MVHISESLYYLISITPQLKSLWFLRVSLHDFKGLHLTEIWDWTFQFITRQVPTEGNGFICREKGRHVMKSTGTNMIMCNSNLQ